MPKYRCAGLICKYKDSSVESTLHDVHNCVKRLGLEVMLEHSTAELLPGHSTVNMDSIGQQCDVAIIIGGDGTLLNAARALVDHDVPLVGVNRGRLGFLCDVSPDSELSDLVQILDGNAVSETRFLLESRVLRDGEELSKTYAFNDVVIRVRDVLQIMDFDVIIDDKLVTHQRADGAIISTPSGSTAYSLSNGGPIVGPSIDAVILQPICPHTLTSRPLMVDARSIIRIHLWDDEVITAQVICDGQVYQEATLGDMVEVKCKDERITLLHPQHYDYHQILREKLNWG